MSEKPNNLESELHRMRPVALPANLISRIGEGIQDNSPSPWAQRRLLSAIWAGSLAACVIVTMLLTQNESSLMPSVPSKGVSSVANINADGPTVAFALADPKWIDSVK